MINFNNSFGIPQGGDPIADLGPIPEVVDDACVQLLVYQGGQTANFRMADVAFFDSGT